MALAETSSPALPQPGQIAFVTKWVASIFQIMGYGATAFDMAPWNIYCFLIGLIGWFAVGLIWQDRAIVLIHVVALGAMVAGMLSA